MVHIFAADCTSQNGLHLLQQYQAELPFSFLAKARSFKYKEDSYRYLLGKILLLHGIRFLGYTNLTLEHIQFNEFNKPFFDNELRFNISHSGHYALCALSRHYKIGIDIEEIRHMDIAPFSNYFTFSEWNFILNSKQPISSFYQIWTRKESVMKADGRGLHIPLLSFDVTNDGVDIEETHWHIQPLNIQQGYAAHLAINKEFNDECYIEQIV